MMLDRDRLNFWVRIVAIFFSAVFVISFVFYGMGSNVAYSPAQLFGGGSQQTSSATATSSPQDQIEAARQQLEEDPKEAENYTQLAGLYYQQGQYDEAEKVLKQGREKAPNEEEIAVFLGQIYAQQAQSAASGQDKTWTDAGDAFAAATEAEADNADYYYFAGQAYEQAGQQDKAVKYWNGYLEREPDGERAKEVRDKISGFLQGGSGQ